MITIHAVRTSHSALLLAGLFGALFVGVAAVAAADEGVQILTRGPIHEAFAEAPTTGTTVEFTIERAPYEPIAEVPPDQRPEGADVAWIPGYWSWDEDRSDFIWVSGVWRDLPPGRQWVPGYWATGQGGYQWISGFWGDAAQTELDYLPPPPQSLEVGPSSPPPRPGNAWSPGCWVWQQNRYDWQPGYWVTQQPDWVWTPARYTWTPGGHVYVPGYWDYDLSHRGVIFAPVYYEQPVFRRPNYYYSPATIIDLRAITACLFVQPRSRWYFFGDYYDARYDSRGLYPWYATHERDYGYDPLYAHYRLEQLRHDQDWDIHVEEQYHHRRNHEDARPPQTLALQITINARGGGALDGHSLGRSLAESARNNTQPLRFRSIAPGEREQIETRGRQVRTYQAERARIETPAREIGKPAGTRESSRAVRLSLPVSPLSTRSTARPDGVKSPPPVPVASNPRAGEGRGRVPKPRISDERPPVPATARNPRAATSVVKNPSANRTERPSVRAETPQRTQFPRARAPRDVAPPVPGNSVEVPRSQAPRVPEHRASTPMAPTKNLKAPSVEPREESPRAGAPIRHGRNKSVGKPNTRGTSQ